MGSAFTCIPCESFFKSLNAVGERPRCVCVWINVDVCVLSHLVASAHRELPVKGSPAVVAQVNTPLESQITCIHCALCFWPGRVLLLRSAGLSSYACDEVRLDGVFVSSGPPVSVQRRPLGSGQWHEDSGHHASGENVNFCLLISK